MIYYMRNLWAFHNKFGSSGVRPVSRQAGSHECLRAWSSERACLAPLALATSIRWIHWGRGRHEYRERSQNYWWVWRGLGCREKMCEEVWRRHGEARFSAMLLLCWMPALCSAFSRPYLPTGRRCSATFTCGSWPMTRRAAAATRTTARKTAMSISDLPSSDAGGIGVDSNMDMGEVLESLRREAASSKRNTLQLLSDRSLLDPSLPSSFPLLPFPPSLTPSLLTSCASIIITSSFSSAIPSHPLPHLSLWPPLSRSSPFSSSFLYFPLLFSPALSSSRMKAAHEDHTCKETHGKTCKSQQKSSHKMIKMLRDEAVSHSKH